MNARAGSLRRVFVVYVGLSLVPVLVLGGVLLQLLHSQGDTLGLAEGRARADLLARTAIAPLLGDHDLRQAPDARERRALHRSIELAIRDGDVLRLRIRDLAGRVVFSGDGSGGGADDEALAAAAGRTVAMLSWLNSDSNDKGPLGPRVVEIYQPMYATTSGRRIGVLEMYEPYAPIAADISRGQGTVTVALGAGLLLLWMCLLAGSASVTRRLRRQVALNTFLATHDALTDLPNRSRFAECATLAISQPRSLPLVVIAVIDLDRFKEVNDILGHGNGDRLLVCLAERLSAHIRPGDTVARLGGDEFGIVLTGFGTVDEATSELARLRRVLGDPVLVDGLPLTVEASVGFAVAPDDASDVDTLLQYADVAMYVAKKQHLGITRYRPEYVTYDSSALTLVAELAMAIEQNQLVLHYQPKGAIQAEDVTAVEALVRWQHPTRGLLYPDAFLPLAEQTELIEDLTRWVLRAATSALPALDPTGRLVVAVNVSARSLTRSDFADEVLAILDESGTDSRRVMAEITETALLTEPRAAARTLRRLHAAGVRISIDDFGAGQTSLSYLAKLPISELKIDKAFVMSMVADPRNAAIVQSVIDLGHNLGLSVTAEGVEDAATLAFLTTLRCDTAQGYLLARPAPSAGLVDAVAHARAILEANGRVGHAPRVA